MQFSARYKGKNGWTIHILPYLFIMHSRIRGREDIVIQLLFINHVQTTADGSKREREGRDEGRKRY